MKKILLGLMLLLLAAPVYAQTKFRLFDQVAARGAGLTPAKGQLFYSSDTSGTIVPLIIGTTGWCLVVDASGVPIWSNVCTGVVSSVGLSAPAQFSVSGSPVTSSGTLGLSWQNVSQNYALLGPVSGSGVPTFRSITDGDLGSTSVFTVFGASGSGHSKGIVPDPGPTPGTSKFLREDATWSVTGSGTVTSVGLSMPSQFGVSGSPVTGSGTLTASWNNATTNYVFAGPSSGGAAAPTFRALVGADYPGFTVSVRGAVPPPVTALGYFLRDDGTWQAVAGGGTVTSVALSLPSQFTITGSPVTGSGTLGASWNTQTAHYFFAAPTGDGTPSFRAIDVSDVPVASATVKGLVPTPPNNSAQVLKGDATWGTLAGVGTVTSVDLSAPTGFTITGSHPVTTSGTLTFGFDSSRTTNTFLAGPDGSTGAATWRAITIGDISSLTFHASGVNHKTGLVPDPGGSAGTTKFLREDAQWELPPQGTVTSVDASVPAYMSISGNPITTSGTLGFGFNTQTANYVFAGPTSGGAYAPDFRLLVPADYPTFVASGSSHAKGAVPDPGVTSGTSKFLREDASWQTPTFNSSIEVKDISGTPDATGVSILRFDGTTGLQVTDNGGGTATVACTTCAGASATATKMDQFIGDGSTTVFTLSSAPVSSGVYFVALNGLPQPTTAWSLGGSNVTMTSAPITGALLAVGYYTSRPSTSTNIQQDFTGSGGTDFTLTYTPIADGVLYVSLRGLVQPQTSWSIVSTTTLRMASAVNTGDTVSISYQH